MQDAIERRGAAEVERLLRTKLKRWRPQAWFTYHLYQKAPDWLGPPIAKRLGIPYLVAEAAYAPTRAKGRWDRGLAAVAAALRRADTVLMLNPNDEECVAPLLRRRGAVEPMLPFLDTEPYRRAYARRRRHRAEVAARHRIPAEQPWLLAVGMMREGDKLASYRVLAKALTGLRPRPWHLLVAGDGPARKAVRAAFAPLGARVHWLGAHREGGLLRFYAASDLLVWPGINEAIGMAILEAQAAGLAVVAGKVGAVGMIVADARTGFLVREGDAPEFRRAVAAYLGLPAAAREEMRCAALAKAGAHHDLPVAADQLDRVLRGAVARAKARRR